MKIPIGLSFDDVLLVPQHSKILPHEVDLSVVLGQVHRVKLTLPVMSSAMDTVTEMSMAIAMAECGGIGIIHQNMEKAAQVDMVKSVKLRRQKIISKPITVEGADLLSTVKSLFDKFRFTGAPVVTYNGKLEGMFTSRDLLASSRDLPDGAQVSDYMTPLDKLIVGNPSDPPHIWESQMLEHRLEKIPLVDSEGNLVALVTLKDLQSEDPLAAVDKLGRYVVGASIGVSASMDDIMCHVNDLVDAGLDVLVLDSAHGDSTGVIRVLTEVMRLFHKDLTVVAGNVVTPTAAARLLNLHPSNRNLMVKVGIGPGSICTTRSVTGVGYPQLSALMNIREKEIPSHHIIADGGIDKTGSIPKALLFSQCVMLGKMLAGTDEAPGELTEINGKLYKRYRGMGSGEAMAARKATGNRYQQKKVAEGVSALVPYKGSVKGILANIRGALQASLGYLGCRNLSSLQSLGDMSDSLVQLTQAGHIESGVSRDLLM